ncbi:MAG: hypothetical protein HYS06_09760 [Methylocystis sp.]|nr:hypothetical protein [Methylocystis sp.]
MSRTRVTRGAVSTHFVTPIAARFPSEAPFTSFKLGELSSFLRRRTRPIVLATIMALLLGVLFYFFATPRYQSTAQLLVDPRGIPLSKNDPAFGQSADGNLIEVETQRYFILSRSIVGAVVDREGLETNSYFGAARGGFGSALRALVLGRSPFENPREAAIAALVDDVDVVRGERAYVLDIVVHTPDPQLSARLANALGRAYLERQNEARAEAARRAGLTLHTRAEQLAREVQDAEAEVEKYKSDHNLAATDGKSVVDQQVADISYQLGLARSQTADQRARFNEMLKLQRSKAFDTLSEAAQSPAVVALRSQYASLVQQKAALAMQFGPQHPALIAVQRQLDDVRALIAKELDRVAGAARTDYQRALAKEATLEKTLEALKQDGFRSGEALVGLRALERRLESSRAIYQSSLTRSKELEETQSIDASTSRVITEAVPNPKRSGAPLVLVIAGALVFGFGMGCGVGYVQDLADGRLRSRRELVDLVGAPVLAELYDEPWRPSSRLRRILGAPDAAARVTTNQASLENLVDRCLQEEDDGRARIILLAGLDRDLRKTRLMMDIGCVGVADDRRVVLVDADLVGRKLSSTWRKESAARIREHAGVRAAGGVIHDDADSLPVVETEEGGLLEVLSLAEVLGERKRALSTRRLWEALEPAAFDVEIMLLDEASSGDAATQSAFSSLADDIILLLDTENIQRALLMERLEVLGPDARKILGIVLIGRRWLT